MRRNHDLCWPIRERERISNTRHQNQSLHQAREEERENNLISLSFILLISKVRQPCPHCTHYYLSILAYDEYHKLCIIYKLIKPFFSILGMPFINTDCTNGQAIMRLDMKETFQQDQQIEKQNRI